MSCSLQLQMTNCAAALWLGPAFIFREGVTAPSHTDGDVRYTRTAREAGRMEDNMRAAEWRVLYWQGIPASGSSLFFCHAICGQSMSRRRAPLPGKCHVLLVDFTTELRLKGATLKPKTTGTVCRQHDVQSRRNMDVAKPRNNLQPLQGNVRQAYRGWMTPKRAKKTDE